MVSGIDEAGFTRPGPCPPWTVGELLYHVRIAVGRVPGMLAEPEPAEDPLVSAVGYYRPGQRFSSATTTDRITAARKGAAALATGTAIGVLPRLARRQGISDMLHRTASRVPGKLAIVSAATRLTFAELDAAVSRTAAALAAEGLKKGDRLALLSRNCWQFAVLSFATARLGVILVPVNFMLGPGEIAYLLSHSEATAFVAEDALAATADRAIAAAGRGVSARAVIRAVSR